MFTINLEKQTMKHNATVLIDNGKPINGYQINNTIVTFDLLDELYQHYKHSIPDGVHNKYNYFKALPYSQLNPIDLITSENRQLTKYNLEIAILTGVLNKSLTWPDDKQWFWQSKKDPDFVILRKWITPA